MAIEIKPSQEGSFTEYAKRHGGYDKKTKKLKPGFAERVANSDAVERIKKKARFAANARKWN